MKSIKQILSEANYMIELSEQSPGDIAARIKAARLKVAELGFWRANVGDDSWKTITRSKEINDLVQQTLQDADERVKTIGPPTFEIDMNNGLGKLPDMNLGFGLDLNIPEDENAVDVDDIGWGFGESDPYYFDSDTPWGG